MSDKIEDDDLRGLLDDILSDSGSDESEPSPNNSSEEIENIVNHKEDNISSSSPDSDSSQPEISQEEIDSFFDDPEDDFDFYMGDTEDTPDIQNNSAEEIIEEKVDDNPINEINENEEEIIIENEDESFYPNEDNDSETIGEPEEHIEENIVNDSSQDNPEDFVPYSEPEDNPEEFTPYEEESSNIVDEEQEYEIPEDLQKSDREEYIDNNDWDDDDYDWDDDYDEEEDEEDDSSPHSGMIIPRIKEKWNGLDPKHQMMAQIGAIVTGVITAGLAGLYAFTSGLIGGDDSPENNEESGIVTEYYSPVDPGISDNQLSDDGLNSGSIGDNLNGVMPTSLPDLPEINKDDLTKIPDVNYEESKVKGALDDKLESRYESCEAMYADGFTDGISIGNSGYNPDLDDDNDGVACNPKVFMPSWDIFNLFGLGKNN